MNRTAKTRLLFLVLLLLPAMAAAQGAVLLREEFLDLSHWRPVTFPKIKEHTQYSIEDLGRETVLRTESHASASAIVYQSPYSVYDYPRLRWKWKVANVYEKGNARTKAGDDYPLRVYVLFEYDPEKAGILEKAKHELGKRIFGEDLPLHTLVYIWANREDEKGTITNAYTSDAKMIVLQRGKKNLDRWIVEERNVLEDYRMTFGSDPPATTTLGIMNDSDNTKEASVSYVGFIEVYK